MHTLREMLNDRSRFLLGVELVTTRGTIADKQALRAPEFSNQLVHSSEVDWVSITDNAGGNPQLSPLALGKSILYAGKEVLIHLSCKDFNRNGLGSEAWELCGEGFHNILALGGDFGRLKYEGRPHRFTNMCLSSKVNRYAAHQVDQTQFSNATMRQEIPKAKNQDPVYLKGTTNDVNH